MGMRDLWVAIEDPGAASLSPTAYRYDDTDYIGVYLAMGMIVVVTIIGSCILLSLMNTYGCSSKQDDELVELEGY